MPLFTLIWSALFSVFATSVICYVALATMLGPWIGPMLALFALMIMPRLGFSKQQMLLAVASGAMGGIIATAISFSFPTVYFLTPDYFNQLLTQPFEYGFLMIGLVVVSSVLGWYVAQRSATTLVDQQQLAFPIGQLVFSIIDAQDNTQQTRGLLIGFAASLGYALLQLRSILGNYALRATVTVWNKLKIGYFVLPGLSLDMTLLPMFLSLGFIAGSLITVPLLVGTVAKTVLVDPLQLLLFPTLSNADFLFAFCSGIVISGTISGLISLPQQVYHGLVSWWNKPRSSIKLFSELNSFVVIAAIMLFGFLHYYQFSILSQIYLIIGSVICAYQVAAIAGKIGLALLGRFATFVMVPGLFLFGYSPLQLTLVATFVELACGVATETLFGYKAAQLAEVDQQQLKWYQLFGILCSAVTVAIIFYYLVTRFELGSAQLFAQRAQARALLLQAAQFNYYVLALGTVFGWCIKQLKINPMLVLGGLLMPLSLSLSLITGGALSLLTRNKTGYESFCSGVYAGNALTVLYSLLV